MRVSDRVEAPATEAINRPVRQRGSSRHRWVAFFIGTVAIVGLAFWLRPFLPLFLSNSAQIEINGVNASDIGWVLSRDGEAVKEFNGLGSLQFNVPPGDYVLTPVKRPLKIGLRYEIRLDGLLAGNGTSKEQDILQFTLNRGETLRITVNAGPSKLIEKKDEPGWIQLFNGKDLTGWKLNPADKNVWRVKDGILVGQGAECSMLPSKRGDFRDFHLRVEAKINEGGDSGVWFRTDLQSQDGYEANINHSHRDPARTGSLGIKKNHNQKWLHHQNNSPAPANTWFILEVIATGPNVSIKVDGVTVAQVTDANRSAGHIGLEMFEKVSVAHFRKIEIKELLSEEPGWVQLFNGKDLTGWKTHPNQPGDWKVESGVLIGSGRKSHLFSERGDYDNFHVRAVAKINNQGDSSLFFRAKFVIFAAEGARGYDAQIMDNQVPGFKTGSLLGLGARDIHVLKNLIKVDEWFTLEVIADENRIIVKVNGETTVDYLDEFLTYRKGYFALQVGSPETVVCFRKIEIKELPTPATPPFAVAPFDAKKAKADQDVCAKRLGIDTEITNSIGMKMRLIPPGEFMMGSSPEEIAWLLKEVGDLKDASDNVRSEGPQRRVTVKEPFYMGVHEVTVGHFRKFVRATKYRTEAETEQGGIIWNSELKKWERKPEYVWDNAELSGGDTHPVVFVTLADAQAFCAWLTKQERRAYAVPAEEQWEWACRAGATTRWFFGNDVIAMKDFGWTTPRSEGKLKRVGHLAPNPFGLYDIYGNANELTMNLQQQAVGRGGEAGESPHRARSASRFVIEKQYDPSYRRGFRVVIVGNLKAKTPSSIDQILKDATLIMNFEKDTFYQREGKTYVRDLSGQGNDGLCDQVEYTPNGQAGGALVCKGGALRVRKGLLNKLPEYTVATWINVDFSKETNFRLLTQGAFRDEKEDEPVFGIQVRLTNMFIDSWNRDMPPKKWKVLHLDFPALEPGWNFVAARLRQGGVGTGELVVTRNDKTLKGDLQMLNANDQQLLVGYRQPGAVDELVIWPRALSDEDLQVIYQQGLTKTPLRSGPPSETWSPLFNGRDLTGWQTDQPDKWKVKNGAIIGYGGKGYLVLTDTTFENFHCRLEAKINADSWGGLAFRHSAKSHGNVSICPKLGKTGSLFYFNKGKNQLLQEPQKQLAAPDTWLNLELIVQGKNVVVLVNGTKTAEASIDGLPDRGPIELCADAPGTVIHFRRIEIKELPATKK